MRTAQQYYQTSIGINTLLMLAMMRSATRCSSSHARALYKHQQVGEEKALGRLVVYGRNKVRKVQAVAENRNVHFILVQESRITMV